VRPDLAREAFREYAEHAFSQRFSESWRKFSIATNGEGVVGFAEVICSSCRSPVTNVAGAELVRLYVQPRAQGSGIGRSLLQEAERLARLSSLPSLWLTVWEGNSGALAFYRRMGYADVGATTYSFEGNTYGNRVFARQLPTA
jgi:ribosomal protein S18 acetylase RimI-like enzyme